MRYGGVVTQADLYRAVSAALVGTAACPVRVALERFNVEWRAGDAEKMLQLTSVGRCPRCMQWMERVELCNTRCKAVRGG